MGKWPLLKGEQHSCEAGTSASRWGEGLDYPRSRSAAESGADFSTPVLPVAVLAALIHYAVGVALAYMPSSDYPASITSNFVIYSREP